MDLDKALKEVAEEFAQNGLGSKHITVTLAGDFPPVVREKKSIRPLYSFESLKSVVVQSNPRVWFNDLGNFSFRKPSTVSIFFRDIEQVSVRQMFLMEHFTGNRENRRLDLGNSEASVSLNLSFRYREKVRESVLAWGWECEQKQSDVFRPEILAAREDAIFGILLGLGKGESLRVQGDRPACSNGS